MGSMAATDQGEMLDRGFLDRVRLPRRDARPLSYPIRLLWSKAKTSVHLRVATTNCLLVSIFKRWSPLICDFKLI